ncbi:unnamed protein product [Thelazia callipaeda]|uniref:Zf-NOSIP domain-containing protein n=1 Tax=Thelazia callipaeda TaxID=103827 RepID=A0A0N5CLX2_THECL|nr:unnamed protein product [Thelazia callipaeda]
MTRHGKNATASAVYSYSERRKDAKESGYGTLYQRLGADSVKEFDCCSITLQPCQDPVISPHGYIFDREAVLEYYLEQKKENLRKLKEWEKQCEKEIEIEKIQRSGSSKRLKDDEISNVAGEKAKEYPSFWIPQLNPSVELKIEKPEHRVFCPLSGKPLKIKELMPVKFTLILIARKVRYMCPVTHDALTNTTRCAYLKTSQNVVTMDCVEKIIKKDMIDPINGKPLKTGDIIELQRGGTGSFASTNEVKAKLVRPQLELQ